MRLAKQIGLFTLCILLCHFVNAQAEDQLDEESNDSSSLIKTAVADLKLKKGYVLGDGVTIRSPFGSMNFSQTVQTLYSFNSDYKNLSNLNSGFDINRARLTFRANIFDSKFRVIARFNLASNFQSATTGNRTFNSTLQDFYFEYRPSLNHAFNIGLRGEYIDTREIRMEGENNAFINRSAVSGAFDAIFDYGIRYRGNYKLGGRHLLRPYLSITTGDGRAGLQKNFGGFRYGIRLDYLPFDKFARGGEFYLEDLAREEKPKLVIGVVYSFNDGASSAVGSNGGRWIYGDVNQKILLPAWTKFGADFLFKYSGFYATGSVVTTKAKVPKGVAGEFRLNGTFSKYSTTQTAEQITNTVLSRLALGSGFNLQGGYLLYSNWAFGARYSTLNPNTITAGFADFNHYYACVISKYLAGNNLKIQTEFGFQELSKALKTPTKVGNYYSQLMVTLQL